MDTTFSAYGQRQTDRQTATLNYEMSTMWEKKPSATPKKTSRVSMGPEKVTRPRNTARYMIK